MVDTVTILVVDDEPNARISLAGILEHAGFSVSTASNSDEAIQILGNQPCDLLFLDINLAGSDGLQLLSFARTFHPKTAVVILTAYVSQELQSKALRNGARDYLIKPIEPNHIIQCAYNISNPPGSSTVKSPSHTPINSPINSN